MDSTLWAYLFGPPREKKALIDLVRELPVFQDCSLSQLVQIERVMHKRLYRKDEIVFNEGEPGAGMYIVIHGEVAIRKRVAAEKQIVLAVIGTRHFFGELALLDEIPRSASAVAVEETELLAFCKPDLERIVLRNPKLGVTILRNISRLVCKRLIKTNQNVETLENKLEEYNSRNATQSGAGITV
ncbi:MAG: cyclic nucleotide-binding domain-containing protein [Chitinivibrionales bacterium]|nr:cyclic nucleotide-binding domain-containing protein [Chitinivibrionales bacterium]